MPDDFDFIVPTDGRNYDILIPLIDAMVTVVVVFGDKVSKAIHYELGFLVATDCGEADQGTMC